MATAVLRPHDAFTNRMHLDAFAPSPTRPRRRRSPKPAGASSSPPPKVASPPPKAAVASPPGRMAAPSRRSPPPPKTGVRKHPSPTKEKRIVMEDVRILKRGEEIPALAPVAQAAAENKRVVRSTARIGPEEPTVVPTKVLAAAVYAGPGFASAPEPSSLPITAFCQRRAETEATRCLRCLLGIGQVA